MKKAVISAAAAIFAFPAWAGEPNSAIMGFIENSARAWFTTPEVQSAIHASNAAHAGMAEADLLVLDQRWRAEVGQVDGPTVAGIVASPVSDTMRGLLMNSGGLVTEIIVMDDRGMNVAVSSVTSDFWQGDEAKFLETYPHGVDAVHVGEIEFDESSQTYQVQVSFSVADVSTGAPLGAVTIGLNAEMF